MLVLLGFFDSLLVPFLVEISRKLLENHTKPLSEASRLVLDGPHGQNRYTKRFSSQASTPPLSSLGVAIAASPAWPQIASGTSSLARAALHPLSSHLAQFKQSCVCLSNIQQATCFTSLRPASLHCTDFNMIPISTACHHCVFVDWQSYVFSKVVTVPSSTEQHAITVANRRTHQAMIRLQAPAAHSPPPCHL